MTGGTAAVNGIRGMADLWVSLAAGVTELLTARTLRTRLLCRMLEGSH